ncbi:MAG: family oxidoreductase [Pseudobdellovibrio sp.]|jgi:NAD(P)-dependent dehydrogenase (short-subunit alcohol dehydrogenase family)|nr:family oxidoreductase [Pseudobdellovibrio sp.]
MSEMKVAFITGANRGIGFETALQLAKQNVLVIIGARHLSDANAAAARIREQGLKAEALKFDAEESKDITSTFDYINKTYGKLDILVNNAGVLLDEEDASVEHKNNTVTSSLEMLKKTFEINFFSVVELTQKLLPLLMKSKAGRIVNVSSILGSLSLHANPQGGLYDSKYFCYDTSKAAMNSFTIHLAHALKDSSVKVNSAHPGWVQTQMGGASAMMSPADGAKTSVRLSLLENDGPSGKFFHLDKELPW